MRVLFAGYRTWAYSIAKNLITQKKGHWKIVGILTTLQLEAPFQKLSIPTTQLDPTKLGEEENLQVIKKYKPDVILFYGWSWMVPSSLYNSYLCLCLHTSPLPKYRGGSPLQHQIMNGEKTSAISIFKMVEELDAGDIYGQKSFSLAGNMETIFDSIVKAGTQETLHVLDRLVKGTLRPIPQASSKATFFKRRKEAESELNIKDFKTKSAKDLYNFTRALGNPYPNAFIRCADGKKLFFTGVKLEGE